ncbi:MAG: choice-of-anchor K domain-containing protein, partial [Halieaceae bacterium]|nr:choice-of-anchor K domain-containing protein [Halieaceae bacterium]
LVTITLTDSDGSVATPQLTLTINDDGPTAVADAASATESGPAVEGNVLGNDQAGADGGITVTGLTGGTVGTALAGAHGSLTLADTGAWTYTPNASVPAGSTDVFTYEITDADGDTSSTTLTLTFAGDSVPVVTVSNDAMVDEDDLPLGAGDQAPGDDAAVPTGQIQYDLGGDSFASIALSTVGSTTPLFTNDGLGVDTFWDASTSTLIGYVSGENPMVAGSQVFTVALSGIDSSSADYAVTLLQPVRHAPSAEEDNVAFSVDVAVTDSDGSVGTSAFTVSIDDDSPHGTDTTSATLVVPLSELAVGSLSAGWQNVTSTSGSGSIASSTDSGGIGLQWGGSNGSGYDFDYAPSLVGNVPVQADSMFSVGSLTHNNFPISASAKVLQTVDLKVSFTLAIDGVPTQVTSTVGLSHTETPNDASPSSNPANDDFLSISNPNQVQVITVGGREFELEILGFRDAQGNLVSSVRTVEGQSTSYELFAEVRSMDDLPELQGTVPGNWGADGPGTTGSLVWTGESGGQVQGSFGVLAVDGQGGYTYTLSAAARDAMSVGEIRQETFTYTLLDDDGDSQQYTLTLNLDGVANASIVDGVVEGMSYETSSGLTGITDEDGGFNYRPGDTVTLRVGGVVLGSFLAEEAIADGKVFLQEIAGVGLHDLNDDHVEKMAVFLQSIDNDPDPYNGIVITDAVRTALADDAFDLDAVSKDALQALLLENGYAPVDEDGAMQHVKDMIVEHTGLTEFDARAADSGALLASPGDDVFAFSLAAADAVAPEVSILGFGEAGNDALDMRDLLQGEESAADLTSYLNVSYDGSNTVIEVSATGAFTGGADDAGAVSQTIHLEGVDLVSGHDDLASVIQNMLDSGRLTVDQ